MRIAGHSSSWSQVKLRNITLVHLRITQQPTLMMSSSNSAACASLNTFAPTVWLSPTTCVTVMAASLKCSDKSPPTHSHQGTSLVDRSRSRRCQPSSARAAQLEKLPVPRDIARRYIAVVLNLCGCACRSMFAVLSVNTSSLSFRPVAYSSASPRNTLSSRSRWDGFGTFTVGVQHHALLRHDPLGFLVRRQELGLGAQGASNRVSSARTVSSSLFFAAQSKTVYPIMPTAVR